MCDQMAAKVHHNALYDESWKKLRATCGERAIEMADLFLRLVRPSIDGRTPESSSHQRRQDYALR